MSTSADHPAIDQAALAQFREVLKAFPDPQEALRSTVKNIRSAIRSGFDLGLSLFEHDFTAAELDEIFEEAWSPAEHHLIESIVEPMVQLEGAPQIKIP